MNLGRRTSVTDPADGVTSFTYDANGNLLTLIDPVGNTTEWTYDNLGRVVEETNELNDSRLFEYDAADRLIARTDRNGRVRQFAHDNLGRLVEETWLDGQTVLETITWAYDAAGQVTSAADGDSAYSYAHDQLGRVTSIDNSGTAGAPQVVLTQQYDAAGQRTELSATISATADFVNTYQYDALGRTTQITQADGSPSAGYAVGEKRVDLAYHANGQFAEIVRYEDLAATLVVASTVYTYDQANRLSDLTHAQERKGDILLFSSPGGPRRGSLAACPEPHAPLGADTAIT